MALVNMPPINNGDDADDSLFNSRLGALADVLNGGVDQANLATGAVTTPKIVDGAVTEVKLADKSVTGSKIVIPSFQAARAADLIEAGSVWRKITLDTLYINIGGFEISNGGIKVPRAGTYEFTNTVSIQDRNPATSTIIPSIGLDANNPGRFIRSGPPDNPAGHSISDMFTLTANQIVYFWVYIATGNNYRFKGYFASGDSSYVQGKLLAAA